MKFTEEYFELIKTAILNKTGIDVKTATSTRVVEILRTRYIFVGVLVKLSSSKEVKRYYKEVMTFLNKDRTLVYSILNNLETPSKLPINTEELIDSCYQEFITLNTEKEKLRIHDLQNRIDYLEKELKEISDILNKKLSHYIIYAE